MSSPTFAPVAELDFTRGGDDLKTWMEKYNAEMENIYACINELISGSGSSALVVDSSMSKTSTNPVQNKVVTAELRKYPTKEEAWDMMFNNGG